MKTGLTAEAPLALVFATRAEAAPLLAAVGAAALGDRPYEAFVAHAARTPLLFAITGMGLAAAERVCGTLIAHERPRAVLNAGIAGALHERLDIGALLNVDAVAEADAAPVDAAGFLALPPFPFADFGEVPLRHARLLSRREPLFDVELRNALAGCADLVDMEGAAIAHCCAAAGLPCALVKAVSDHANDRASLLRNLADGAARIADHLAHALCAQH